MSAKHQSIQELSIFQLSDVSDDADEIRTKLRVKRPQIRASKQSSGAKVRKIMRQKFRFSFIGLVTHGRLSRVCYVCYGFFIASKCMQIFFGLSGLG